MKAKFFFLGLCALALAACSIDEVSQVNDTNAVTFNTRVATRATATTTSTIMDFSVWAWNGEIEFMDDVVATRSGSSSTFTTSPLYFWPTGTVDFYALSPSTTVTAIEDNQEYAYIGGTLNTETSDWTYTGNVAKAKISKGAISLDVAVPGSASEQLDLCYGVATGYSSGSVPMNFRHALSQVVFKAKDVNPDFVVDIAGISVCSVSRGGTYTLPTSNTTTNLATTTVGTDGISDSQGTWVVDDESRTRFEAGITAQTLATDGTVADLTAADGALMLIPQEVEAWDVLTDYNDTALGSYIVVLCHVTENGSQLWPNGNEEQYEGQEGANIQKIDGVEYAYIAMPVKVEWEEGYRYTYTIVFGEGLGYYPPDDPNFDLEGTPVLVPITFTVSVDEFQDVDAVEVPTDTDLSTITVSSAAELVGALRMGYEVIDVAASFALEDDIYVNNNCTINIKEGVTLTDVEIFVNTSCTVNIEEGASVVAYNDPDKGATAAFWVADGTLTINSEGTVTTTGGSESENTMCVWVRGVEDGANAAVIINGGEYYGSDWNAATDSSDGNGTIYVQKGFAYIYDGEFYGAYCKTFKETSILNCYDSNRSNGSAWIYVYGGDFYDFDPASNNAEDGTREGLTNFCADGYSTVYDETTGCYTVILTTVATPADLAAALAAGASEITVSESFSIEQGGTDDKYGYFRVYNDCTITLEDGVTISLEPMTSIANYGFFVVNSGTLTVEGNGTLMSQGAHDDMGAMCFWIDGGDVVINGGNYYSCAWTLDEAEDSGHCVYVNKGSATITAGTFVTTQKIYKSVDETTGEKTYWGTNFLLNCSDGNYNTGDANIYVSGGTYCNFDPHNNAAEGSGTNFCVENYITTSEEGTLTLSDGSTLDVTWYTVVEDNN